METLTVQGKLTSIQLVTDYVTTAATMAGLDAKATYRLRLAVDEIATNIVTHGYQAAGLTGNLTITAVIHTQYLHIYLEDSGLSYDPRLAPSPNDLDKPPNQRKAGQLGIYLAMWGVDNFLYEQVHGRNRCTFIMKRPAPKEVR